MRRRTVGVRRVWRRRQVAARHSPPSVSRAPAACGQGTRSAFPRRKLAVACCAYVSLGGRVADLHMCVNVIWFNMFLVFFCVFGFPGPWCGRKRAYLEKR